MHMALTKGGKRCVTCLLPRPCRHHERELFRSQLSESELEQEDEREEKVRQRNLKKIIHTSGASNEKKQIFEA